MADESGEVEVNTAVEDGEEKQQQDEPEVSGAETHEEAGDSDGQGRTEKPAPETAVENSWSAPILSLARKATETISSGVSYAAAPRNPAPTPAASCPTEGDPGNELNNTSKKLPGRL